MKYFIIIQKRQRQTNKQPHHRLPENLQKRFITT